MLISAAILLVGVGLLHSVKGGKHLIEPILRTQGLPIAELTFCSAWAAN
jgi:hypothetical protein